MKSNLYRWAEAELSRLTDSETGKLDPMQRRMNKHLLHMVHEFSKERHSGFSARYAIQALYRLLSWKPLTHLTGDDSEWNDITDLGPGRGILEQNKRCSAVFRNNRDNSTAYYLDGKIFSDDGGETWFTSSDSCIPVIFPFRVPDKPEYVILPKQEDPK